MRRSAGRRPDPRDRRRPLRWSGRGRRAGSDARVARKRRRRQARRGAGAPVRKRARQPADAAAAQSAPVARRNPPQPHERPEQGEWAGAARGQRVDGVGGVVRLAQQPVAGQGPGDAQPSGVGDGHSANRLPRQLRTRAGPVARARRPRCAQRRIKQSVRSVTFETEEKTTRLSNEVALFLFRSKGRVHPTGRSHPAHQPAKCVWLEFRRGGGHDARVEAAHDARRRVRRGRLGRSGERRLLAQARQAQRVGVKFWHHASRFEQCL